jgi:acyl carrier protein
MQFVDVVADVLEADPVEITDDANPDTLPNWTSLRHLQLIVALEEVYGLSFAYREIRQLNSIGQLRDLLRARGVTV